MSISRQEVLRIARLARIQLSDDEIDRIGEDLSSILDYVETLDELDLEGVDPQTHATVSEDESDADSALREDRVEQTLTQQEALQNAPDTEDGHFRVPKVVED